VPHSGGGEVGLTEKEREKFLSSFLSASSDIEVLLDSAHRLYLGGGGVIALLPQEKLRAEMGSAFSQLEHEFQPLLPRMAGVRRDLSSMLHPDACLRPFDAERSIRAEQQEILQDLGGGRGLHVRSIPDALWLSTAAQRTIERIDAVRPVLMEVKNHYLMRIEQFSAPGGEGKGALNSSRTSFESSVASIDYTLSAFNRIVPLLSILAAGSPPSTAHRDTGRGDDSLDLAAFPTRRKSD
jgi:hypothetical protein